MNKRVSKIIAATALASVFAGSAVAASQGNLGRNSSGSVDIRASIPGLIKISNLDDIDLGTWSGTGDLVGSDENCVWSTTRGYNLTANGSGDANAFTITDGINAIAYSVTWDDVDTADQDVTAGQALSSQVTNAVSVNCAAGGDTANVAVTLEEADIAAAPAGNYSGTLTLIVSPE